MKEKKADRVRPTFKQTVHAAKGLYRRLFMYVKPYKWRFILGIGFGAVFGSTSGLLPLVISQVWTFVFEGAVPNAKSAFAHREELLTHGAQINSSIFVICLLIPLIMTVRSLLSFGSGYYMTWVSNRVVTDIRNDLFNKLISHSMDFFNKMRTGFLMSRVANDTRSMQMALNTVSADVFKQPVSIISAIAVLCYFDWKFTLVTLVLFPVCLLPMRYLTLQARRAVQNEQTGMALMTTTMQETFAGIRVVKSFAREAFQEKAFKKATQQQFSNSMRMTRMMEAIGPMVEAIAAIGVGLALFYVKETGLPAGKFVGLLTGIFMLYDPIKTLSKLHIVMQRTVGATQKIFALLDSIPSVQNAPDALALKVTRGEIDFQGTTFRYATGITDAVHDLNLRVEAGKTFALVGASGAGKSTILSLILRLYDPTAGAIRIDGQDLRQVTQRSLRNQIGLVTQETFLFHDTIFKNILFGRLDATPEEVYAAAQTAFAHEFITAQPDGYHTVIGDKGCLLSGGQQQRIAIARALLKNAPILLLDEATSALDSESEQQIQRALERLSAGRTVIAIAHRLSTILSADQIVVMEHGRIKEVGTHAELLEKSGHYRRLYDLQFNRVTEEPHPETTPEPDVFEEELV
jgi:subfamily B ATP-binding cassette protein MsbA